MRRSTASPHIPEALLRRLWHDGAFTSSGLRTSDGRSVAILSPGTPNNDEGPDFHDAAIRIGSITYRGDVELHVDARSWVTHRHQRDPHYNSVILHVVLTAGELQPPSLTASMRQLPLLVLHPFLDPVTDQRWVLEYRDEAPAANALPACPRPVDSIPPGTLEHLVRRLSRERLEMKILRMEERLRQLVDEARGTMAEPYPRYYGNPREIPRSHPGYALRDYASRHLWEQLLYEGLMEGMGYAKNRSAFLALARSVRLATLRSYGLDDTPTMMAILFGAAGLLPSSRGITEPESRTYLLSLRRAWKEIRPRIRRTFLHEGDWLFFRLRPVNFPTARLAALCHLLPALFKDAALRELVGIFKSPRSPRDSLADLQRLFGFEPDAFWRYHCHFRGRSSLRGIALGRERVNALLVNTLVPLLLLYARLFHDRELREKVLAVAQSIPASHPNSITASMERKIFRGRLASLNAVDQQGILQLYQAYCLPRRCGTCALGAPPPGNRRPA